MAITSATITPKPLTYNPRPYKHTRKSALNNLDIQIIEGASLCAKNHSKFTQ